jgi:hypothetical protein
MLQLQEKQTLIQFCDTSHWRSIVGLTLNLKQSIPMSTGGFVTIDEVGAKKAFRGYMNVLNRSIYKSAFRHHGKRLRVIPILEKSIGGRWHYHIAIEPPTFIEHAAFGELAMQSWLQTEFGYGCGDIASQADPGWITYMVKHRTKSAFEHYFDCIDIDSFFNPVASV